MDHLPQLLQALSIAAGVITTVVGLVVVRSKNRGASELKAIDVSAEWQQQMLSRISLVEQELKSERVRGDMLVREGHAWRAQAGELEWELKRARTERLEMVVRVERLSSENSQLKDQNTALGNELREMHRQIRGGFQSLSLKPPALPSSLETPRPPKFPRKKE